MNLPGWRAWVFSAKAFVAACLALYIALWMDLPRPYWAMTTVYVVAQPFAGTTLSKGAYRLAGTLLGAIGAVLLVPNLAKAPELLAAGFALWTGTCLFLSLMDRRPHSYVFMLAGYTAPIIGFPSVDDPGAIFTTAIARVQEIGLGIVCATLVGTIVLPQSNRTMFARRVGQWLRHATGLAREVLGGRAGDSSGTAARGRLAADAIDLDVLAAHLGFDPAAPGGTRRTAEMLRSRMLLLLPLTSSIESRVAALQPYGLPDGIAAAMVALDRLLADGAPAAAADDVRRLILSATPALGAEAGWPDLLRANLCVRLRDLLDLHLDCAALQAALQGSPAPLRLALPDIDAARGTGARHVDRGLALASALAAVAAMGAGAWFWIASGWPDGASLMVGIAVACSFFATLDNPVRPQLAFAKWSLVAVLLSAVYGYAILPLAQEYETLVLLIMPVLLLAGLVAANPATALIGLAIAANLPALIGFQARYSADFAGFANGGIALIGGLWFAAAFTSVARVLQPRWVAHRLLRASERALADAAATRGRGDRAVFASLMLDRAGQVAPRLAADAAAPDAMAAEMMAVIRIGLNVVDLRRARHALPARILVCLDAVLDGLAAEFRARDLSRNDPEHGLRLAVVDAALGACASLAASAPRDDALLGLVGIRLGVFPDAPAYAPPSSGPARASGPMLEHAA
jgi:uncharacterized membrane protein YccC